MDSDAEERIIINPYCLNSVWELVWNSGEIFDFDIGNLQMPSNPTHLLFYSCRLFLVIGMGIDKATYSFPL